MKSRSEKPGSSPSMKPPQVCQGVSQVLGVQRVPPELLCARLKAGDLAPQGVGLPSLRAPSMTPRASAAPAIEAASQSLIVSPKSIASAASSAWPARPEQNEGEDPAYESNLQRVAVGVVRLLEPRRDELLRRVHRLSTQAIITALAPGRGSAATVRSCGEQTRCRSARGRCTSRLPGGSTAVAAKM